MKKTMITDALVSWLLELFGTKVGGPSTKRGLSLWFFECLCLRVFGSSSFNFKVLKIIFLSSTTLSQLKAAPKAPALIPVRTNWPRDFDPTTLQRTELFGKKSLFICL